MARRSGSGYWYSLHRISEWGTRVRIPRGDGKKRTASASGVEATMKTTLQSSGTPLLFLLLLTALILLLSLTDLSALHDIRYDYVSAVVIQRFRLPLSQELPAWTRTPGEWAFLSMSICLRLICAATNLVLVAIVIRRSTES